MSYRNKIDKSRGVPERNKTGKETVGKAIHGGNVRKKLFFQKKKELAKNRQVVEFGDLLERETSVFTKEEKEAKKRKISSRDWRHDGTRNFYKGRKKQRLRNERQYTKRSLKQFTDAA